MGSEVFAGDGNDFIYGNKNAERILGNEGDDWIETGTFDGAPGDNFDEIFSHDDIDGNDVFLGDGGFDEFIGEGGDDIFVGSAGPRQDGRHVRLRLGDVQGQHVRCKRRPVASRSSSTRLRRCRRTPRSTSTSRWKACRAPSFNDVLKGSNTLAEERLPVSATGVERHRRLSAAATWMAGHRAHQRVSHQVLGQHGVNFYNAGDIILGGDGSDLIQGNAGDDIIDGDK